MIFGSRKIRDLKILKEEYLTADLRQIAADKAESFSRATRDGEKGVYLGE
jgi:hypothetical protein